jgi:hypothetical protein
MLLCPLERRRIGQEQILLTFNKVIVNSKGGHWRAYKRAIIEAGTAARRMRQGVAHGGSDNGVGAGDDGETSPHVSMRVRLRQVLPHRGTLQFRRAGAQFTQKHL